MKNRVTEMGLPMRRSTKFLQAPLVLLLACLTLPAQTSIHSSGIDAQTASVANLPARKIAPSDLIAIAFYDAPELTRTVRVGADGMIEIPMLHRSVKAEGLHPAELEIVLIGALKSDEIILKPIVAVTILEHSNRTGSVLGAVGKPVTFPVIARTRLLDALAKAEGLAPDAGQELLLSRPGGDRPQRFNLKELMSGNDMSLNAELDGNEEIRVPEARKVNVVGSVKKPGAITEPQGSRCESRTSRTI